MFIEVAEHQHQKKVEKVGVFPSFLPPKKLDPLGFWLPLHRTSRLCHLSKIFFFHTTLHQSPLEDLHRNAALKIMGSLKKKKRHHQKLHQKSLIYIFLINSFYIFLHFWHMRDHEPYQSILRLGGHSQASSPYEEARYCPPCCQRIGSPPLQTLIHRKVGRDSENVVQMV